MLRASRTTPRPRTTVLLLIFIWARSIGRVAATEFDARSSDRLLRPRSGFAAARSFQDLSDWHSRDKRDPLAPLPTELRVAAGGRGVAPRSHGYSPYPAIRRTLHSSSTFDEEIWNMPRIGLLENVSRDVLYALRTMRRNPAFAVTIVLTLALGIGANTAIFSVNRAVLLKPLAYPDPDRLVWMSGGTPVWFEECGAQLGPSSEIGAFLDGIEKWRFSGVGRPEVLRQARVSGNFLEILGVQPLLGRGFRPEEDAASGPRVRYQRRSVAALVQPRPPDYRQHATLEATSVHDYRCFFPRVSSSVPGCRCMGNKAFGKPPPQTPCWRFLDV